MLYQVPRAAWFWNILHIYVLAYIFVCYAVPAAAELKRCWTCVAASPRSLLLWVYVCVYACVCVHTWTSEAASPWSLLRESLKTTKTCPFLQYTETIKQGWLYTYMCMSIHTHIPVQVGWALSCFIHIAKPSWIHNCTVCVINVCVCVHILSQHAMHIVTNDIYTQ